MTTLPYRPIFVLATLVAGCASLPPSRPIDSLASLAGNWHGRMASPAGNAPVLLTIQGDGSYRGILYLDPTYRETGGVISVIGPGRARYEGSDGGGGGARLTPAP